MVKFEKLFKLVKKSSTVFITGHKNLDLDALASCIALSNLIDRIWHKQSYIIIDEQKHELGVAKALNYINENMSFNFIDYSETKNLIDENSLLIIADTYIEKRIQNTRILRLIPNRVFVDHHLFGKPISSHYFIDANASSCSEMLSTYYLRKNFKVNKHIANILYSGIIIDTNYFSIKTTSVTHEICSYLLKCGASTKVSSEFVRSNIEDYIKIQKIVFNTEFYKKKYAFVKCNENKYYEIEELAKSSDTLIKFSEVLASFSIGYIEKNIVGVSARCHPDCPNDISTIMKKLGGGGSKTTSAAQVENKSIQEVARFIKGELK